MSRKGKFAIFIDGGDTHVASKALGFDIDYRRLLNEFQARGTLLRAFYYVTWADDQEYSSLRPLVDWLGYNGFTVVMKESKNFAGASGSRNLKGNMEVELAVDALQLADRVEEIILFSGNVNFRPLVKAVQRRGVLVTVVSTIPSHSPGTAADMRRQADSFIDLKVLKPNIART